MKKIIGAAALLAVPFLASAQAIVDINTLIAKLTNIGNAIIPIAISFAVIYLVIAIVRYVIAGNDDDKAVGKSMVVYGIIGLFLILSIWGLVNILRRTFVTDSSVPTQDFPRIVTPPQIP